MELHAVLMLQQAAKRPTERVKHEPRNDSRWVGLPVNGAITLHEALKQTRETVDLARARWLHHLLGVAVDEIDHVPDIRLGVLAQQRLGDGADQLLLLLRARYFPLVQLSVNLFLSDYQKV